MADQQSPLTNSDIVELATELTAAWLTNPNAHPTGGEAATVLGAIHAALGDLAAPTATAEGEAVTHQPAVPVRGSVKPDYLVSLITGQKLRTLKRHLARHGLTPADYRARYGLKPDYPMVAANYSEARSVAAKAIGLGGKRAAKPALAKAKGTPAKASAASSSAAPAKPRGRPRNA